jgi:hypothetical protein
VVQHLPSVLKALGMLAGKKKKRMSKVESLTIELLFKKEEKNKEKKNR